MAGPRIAVVDYHKGNLSSVARGLERAGATATVTDDPDALASADAIVLPGVGAFADAMAFMRESGQAEALVDQMGEGKPMLGICLGLHLLFEHGHEGAADAPCPGLGVLSGSVTRLESTRLKVPHMGWDQLMLTDHGRACPLFAHVDDGANVYYTHSYALADNVDPAIVATRSLYTRGFASGVWADNIVGLQFHPEKSSGVGELILRGFIDMVKGAA